MAIHGKGEVDAKKFLEMRLSERQGMLTLSWYHGRHIGETKMAKNSFLKLDNKELFA